MRPGKETTADHTTRQSKLLTGGSEYYNTAPRQIERGIIMAEDRIFNHYKQELENVVNSVRFNIIQYLCSFPEINPYEMAAAIITDGYTIAYDDTSIPN